MGYVSLLGKRSNCRRFEPRAAIRKTVMKRAQFSNQSMGLIAITGLAVVSGLYGLLRPDNEPEGLTFWRVNESWDREIYSRAIEDWKAESNRQVNVEVLGDLGLWQRMRSSFFSGSPVADLIEMHLEIMMGVYNGPEEAIGFLDLTELLQRDGLLEVINRPTLSPWSSRGHIYGIPVTVSGVLLAYRADIVEEAGIDMAAIETWDEFMDTLRPLVQDVDGDGFPDRYLLEMEEGSRTGSWVEMLILQAGGRYFDPDGKVVINSETNARVISKIALWGARPDKLIVDIPVFTLAGNQLLNDGYVVAWLVSDWRTKFMKLYLKPLAGKVKLMPIPAWEKGGRRTSVLGSRMLGIPKTGDNIEESWDLVKKLYLDRKVCRDRYLESDGITPLTSLWDDPIYDQPDPFFMGQKKGRMFIEQAPEVPEIPSSAYNLAARRAVASAAKNLRDFAEEKGITTSEDLYSKAHELLAEAEAGIRFLADRNSFLRQ